MLIVSHLSIRGLLKFSRGEGRFKRENQCVFCFDRRVRLFFAAPIPEDVRAGLSGRMAAGRGLGGVRWTPPEALHLTLRFLGETVESRLPEVERAGEAAAAVSRFSLALEGAGVFPSARQPKIFWAGIRGDLDQMRALAEDLEARAVELGYPPESRRFTPHLTLARARADVRLNRAASEKFLAALCDHRSAPFIVKEIRLLRSHMGPSGSRYETLRTFPLR